MSYGQASVTRVTQGPPRRPERALTVVKSVHCEGTSLAPRKEWLMEASAVRSDRRFDREPAQATSEPPPAPAIADPAPLGLAAFALTTFVLSFFNARIVGDAGEPIVLGLALAYGGLAQLLAGMWEFRNNNTFGATAFTSYGAFWLSLWAFDQFFADKVPASAAGDAVGLYLVAWGIFTTY